MEADKIAFLNLKEVNALKTCNTYTVTETYIDGTRPMNLLHKLPYKFASAVRGEARVGHRGGKRVGPPWVPPPTFKIGIFILSLTCNPAYTALLRIRVVYEVK